MNQDCIVIIPVYKPLDEAERAVVRQAVAMTEGFAVRFAAPRSLVFDDSFAGFEDLAAERFEDEFFKGIRGYNWLMLCPEFYERFRGFKYILIHQTDAYIFKPELQQWCDHGWDYIGAPWYSEKKMPRYEFWQKMFRRYRFLSSCKPVLRQVRYNNPGNGGLSLRKTESFLSVLEAAPPKLLDRHRSDVSSICNEDVFWGVQAPAIIPDFMVPDWREAMRFSIERHPSRSFEVIGGTLPFGCHAFRKMEPDFWKAFIPSDCF